MNPFDGNDPDNLTNSSDPGPHFIEDDKTFQAWGYVLMEIGAAGKEHRVAHIDLGIMFSFPPSVQATINTVKADGTAFVLSRMTMEEDGGTRIGFHAVSMDKQPSNHRVFCFYTVTGRKD